MDLFYLYIIFLQKDLPDFVLLYSIKNETGIFNLALSNVQIFVLEMYAN